MKLFYTVIFFSSLTSAAFAREESILARVTTYWAGEGQKYASTGQRLRSGHCAVDAQRSIPGLRSSAAKPLVYADGLRANSRQSWSTDFLKQSEKQWRGRVRIHTL